jgi:hypothetical protein
MADGAGRSRALIFGVSIFSFVLTLSDFGFLYRVPGVSFQDRGDDPATAISIRGLQNDVLFSSAGLKIHLGGA